MTISYREYAASPCPCYADPTFNTQCLLRAAKQFQYLYLHYDRALLCYPFSPARVYAYSIPLSYLCLFSKIQTELSLTEPLIITRFQNFRGQHGKAYLFGNVVNIINGDASERNMTTGRHVVRDISCRQCKETVGWKYDKAYENSEKYKEGKFILEAELLSQVY